jgi:BrnA antitoxin of type II toxin-antitoxin system
MRKEYDFSKGKRGPVVPTPSGKTRITIRLDDDVLAWFRAQVHEAGGGNYQTLINGALRDFMASQPERLEDTLRRVLREERAAYGSGVPGRPGDATRPARRSATRR